MAFLIYSTWPDHETATKAAQTLLKQGLISCANICTPGTSIYAWQGEITTESEVQMWLKTGATNIDALRAAVITAHPFEVPAFIAFTIDLTQSHAPFMQWLAQTSGKIT
ncbi:MAG: divalent-cation tolerance protein CutA [Robiginitomaculum sp.]|nr:divalent-cation tolerance protein CutA [Robiginitomaculum sp.]